MKKIILLLCLIFSISSFASICKSSHLEIAIKKSNTKLINTEFRRQSLLLGSTWTPLGLAFLSVGTPAIVATGAGVFFLYRGLKGTIQAPKYKLVIRMLAAEKEEDYVNLNRSRLFTRLMKKAKKLRPYITEQELASKFVEGIESGEFCKESGKPYTFGKMKRTILNNL